jgi:hypothetical protein
VARLEQERDDRSLHTDRAHRLLQAEALADHEAIARVSCISLRPS